jgi:hypothetical protein
MNKEDFYAECAAIIGSPHEGEAFTHYKRTRWNNRTAGRGRFPGCGIIRVFGDTVHISLKEPKQVFGIIEGHEQALAFLRAELSVGV